MVQGDNLVFLGNDKKVKFEYSLYYRRTSQKNLASTKISGSEGAYGDT